MTASTRVARGWIGLALGGALALACGSGEEPAPSGGAPPAAEAPAPPPAKAPAPPPAEAQPVATAPDASRGEGVYQTYCASCHGERGDSDGPLGQSLNPAPAKHSDGAYMNALSNQHLFRVIQGGGPAVGKSPLMAPWGGSLSEEQIWDVIAFVRTLAKPAYTGSIP